MLDDPRNELFICFVDHYRANTKYFFDKAYYVRKESVPGFLQGLEDQILQCGKYTMLLRAYNPSVSCFIIAYECKETMNTLRLQWFLLKEEGPI